MLKKISQKTSGQSKIRPIYKNLILEYQNVEISSNKIKKFLNFINVTGVSVTLSERKTKRTLGTAWPSQGRTILYRHSVSTFLHELAHLLAYRKYLSIDHGHDFASVYEMLIDNWEKFK